MKKRSRRGEIYEKKISVRKKRKKKRNKTTEYGWEALMRKKKRNTTKIERRNTKNTTKVRI